MNNTNNDMELLANIMNDDIKAYNELFKKYYPSLCAYCYRFVSDHEVEDIVQEVMIWIWENRKENSIKSSISNYLFKMVYNKCLNHINQSETKQKVEIIFHEHINSIPEIDHIHLNELEKRTNNAIENLPTQYKETFTMHRFKDMSYKQIAELLNVSPKTVDYRIQQSLKLLRQNLKDYLLLIIALLY